MCILGISIVSCTHRAPLPSYAIALDSIKKEVLSDDSKHVAASYDSMMAVIGTATDKVSREYQLYLLFSKIRTDELGLNDSLSAILVEEFSSSSPLLKSLSYFVDGSARLEKGATEYALTEFYKALDVPGINEHPRQCLRVCLAISYIYYNRGLYDLALAKKFEAADYAKQYEDYEYLAHTYREIADLYEFSSKNDSAAIYFQKAFQVANNSGELKAVYYTNFDYVRFLMKSDSLEKAKRIMHSMPIPSSNRILTSYLANKLHCCYAEGKHDSCVYYCNKLAQFQSPFARLSAYGTLYQSYRGNNDDAGALDALEHYTNLNDSIFDIHKVEEIRKISNKYDYLLAEKNKEAEEKRFVFWTCSIVLVALLIVFILYSFIQQQKLRNLKRVEIMKARLKLRQLRYEKSTQSLEDRKQEVDDLKHQLEKMATKESSADLQLTKVRKQLAEVTVRLKSVEMTSNQMEEKSFRESPACRKIVDAINNQEYAELDLEDWKVFQSGCQKAYPSLFEAVSEFSFSMSADELKICYLTKLGVTPTEISRLLFKSPSAVSKNKVRMYTKLMNKSGKTADFDALINSL